MFGKRKSSELGGEEKSFGSVPTPEGCKNPEGWAQCIRDINEPEDDAAWNRGVDTCRSTYCD